MKLVLDEWIIREVIDTLYMARTTLLGITGLDSPQEVAKKSANETAITRRISKAIDIIQQSKQPEVDLEHIENDAELIANKIMIGVQSNRYHTCVYNTERNDFNHSHLVQAARKGIELGLKARK